MVKIPKLTDLESLKKMGNDLVEKAKATVGDTTKMTDMAKKMRDAVVEQTGLGSKKAALSEDHPVSQLATNIQALLKQMYDSQKQQVAVMNDLKQQIQLLIAVLAESNQDVQTSEGNDDEHSTPEN